MIPLLYSILVSILMGFILISLLTTGRGFERITFLFRLSLGAGFGIGISSMLYFIWLVIFGPRLNGFIVTELAFLIVLSGFYLYKMRGRNISIDRKPAIDNKPAPRRLFWILLTGFSIVLVSSLVSALLLSVKMPHGRWDAWYIWNMRARFLFRGGEHWTDAFSPQLAHADYPLYLPAYIARCWSYIGSDTVLVPVAISMLFIFATAGLLYSALCVLRTRSQGLLAGIVLLGTPFFIAQGVSQIADVPLGFFFLAAVTLLVLAEKLPERRLPLLFICGAAAGMSAWIKNEGLLFILSIVIALICTAVITRDYRKYLSGLSYFALGVLPVFLVIIYFKTHYAVSNDIIALEGFHSAIERIFDLSRYSVVAIWYKRGVFNFGNFIFSPIIVLLVYMLIAGVRTELSDKQAVIYSLFIVILMAVGYFAIYIITPHDLKWHLLTSLGRLLLQLWPTVIFLYFLAVRSPDRFFVNEE